MNQTFKCPKCQGNMRTVQRGGVQIEQCTDCRGIFLDYGELENITQMENQWAQQEPPPYVGPPQQQYAPAPQQYDQPGWGRQPHHGGRRRGFSRMLFSS